MTISRNGRSVAGTFFLILLSILGISLIDRFLARTERLESHREAERLFTEGRRLEQAGNYSHAIDRFRAALSVTGEQEDYADALAGVLLKAGQPQEAEPVLAEVLQRDPINGEANLMMARVLLKQGNIAQAESYYHDAIYDRWRDQAAHHRLQARLELIESLAHQDRKKDLLSVRVACSSARCRREYRRSETHCSSFYPQARPDTPSKHFDILRYEPENASAYAGLGEAEFARANTGRPGRTSGVLSGSIPETSSFDLTLNCVAGYFNWIRDAAASACATDIGGIWNF
jgi:tetratricopeptide (TPR) repeat protein